MPRYAAVDIGSNSVRLQVAEQLHGAAPRILASERQVTRLGESVFRSGRISADAMELTCEVLAGMAGNYRGFEVLGIRAVATAAVRDASNQIEFIERASAAVQAPVEIISAAEESRLVHLGVQCRWPHPSKRILIVDSGGGSGELIFSENGRIVASFSRPLGAVRLKEMFLHSDPPAEDELRHMDEYIEEKLAAARKRMGGIKVDRVIATSATAAAVVCAVNRIPRAERDTADRLRASATQVRKLYAAVSGCSLARRRKMTGIGLRRAEIIVPGVALLRRVLDDFKLPSLFYSAAGVRDGVIADLVARGTGRERSELSRDQRRTVQELGRRYSVSPTHARKVAELAHSLFDLLHDLHRLAPEEGRLLQAAALLHDTGHYVSDTRHHKHSYYLVANSDLPGFTERERNIVANLCRYHRKSMPTALHPTYQSLPPEDQRVVLLLSPLLRLADALDRSRNQIVERLSCQIRNTEVTLELHCQGNPDLELWAAGRVADLFREIYTYRLLLAKVLR